MNKILITVAIAALLTAFGVQTALAAPSFGVAKRFQLETTLENGDVVPVTVFGDHQDPNRFYYAPVQPHLSMMTRDIGGEERRVPRVSLLQMQLTDPSDTSSNVHGGFFQASIELGLDGDQVIGLVAELARRLGDDIEPDDLILAQLPITDPKLMIYDPQSNNRVGVLGADAAAPSDLTLPIPMTMKFDQMNFDLAKGLTTDSLGLDIIFTYSAEFVTDDRGFVIEIDWDQSHKVLTENTATAKQLRDGWWVFSWDKGSEVSNTMSVSDVFTTNNALTVKPLEEGVPMSPEEQEVYLRPALAQMQAAFFGAEEANAPVEYDPALGEDQVPAVPSGNQGIDTTSTASKSIDILKTRNGTQRLEFRLGTLLDQPGLIPGSLSLQGLDPVVKEALISVVLNGNWDQLYLPLPEYSPSPDLGIREVNLTAVLTDGQTTGDSRGVVWRPDGPDGGPGGWYDIRTDAPRRAVVFPLLAWRERYKLENPSDPDVYKSQVYAQIKTQVRSGSGIIEATSRVAAAQEDNMPFAPIGTAYKEREVVLRGAQFGQEPELLDYVSVLVTDPQSGRVYLDSGFDEGAVRAVFIVPNDVDDVEVEAFFEYLNEDVVGSEGPGFHRWSRSGPTDRSRIRLDQTDCVSRGAIRDVCLTGE